MIKLPHTENLRNHRWVKGSGTFFITKCLTPRKRVLTEHNIADSIIEAFDFAVTNDRIHLAAFVIMPDHWHALFAVPLPWTLPKIMKTMGTWISKKSLSLLQQYEATWQVSYYDTRIRSGKQFRYVIHYIENNPVKKGLVKTREDWSWSSANSQYQSLLTRPWSDIFDKDTE